VGSGSYPPLPTEGVGGGQKGGQKDPT